MSESNLNPPWLVKYRRFNQWLRRLYLSINTREYHRLLTAKRFILVKDQLTPEDRAELERLNWQLGNGMPYRFTPEQTEKMNQWAREVIKEWAKEQGREVEEFTLEAGNK